MKRIAIVFMFLMAAFVTIGCKNVQESDTSEISEAPNQEPKPEVQVLAQNELSSKLNEDNVVLIDVRTQDEVNQGYIPEASQFIDFYSDDFNTEIDKLDKSKTYVMYCRSGGRSGKAANYMINSGFNTVYNLQGGITNYSGDLKK